MSARLPMARHPLGEERAVWLGDRDRRPEGEPSAPFLRFGGSTPMRGDLSSADTNRSGTRMASRLMAPRSTTAGWTPATYAIVAAALVALIAVPSASAASRHAHAHAQAARAGEETAPRPAG